jgi:predicted nucleic-acid-binding protein
VIGLDTNVLVRFFALDDPLQHSRTEKFIRSLSSVEPGWVSLPVLMELLWVMGSVYRFDRAGTITILDQLLSRQEIVVEQSETVYKALQLFISGNVDFPDCLIAASAKAAGCTRTVTFDRRAARETGMQLPG